MAILRTIRGTNAGQQFAVEGDAAVLGRHPDCDIVLESLAVSRQHARIVRLNGNYYVEDLNSRNGTFLNGRLVTERQLLNDNDEVQICDLTFAFYAHPPESLSRPVPGRPEATMMIEDEQGSSGSAIMSKVNVASGPQGLQLEVNAQAKLKALIEIGQSLGKAIGLNEVLSKVLDSLFKIFPQADRSFIVLKHPETGRLIPKAVKYRRHEDTQTIRISRTIIAGVMNSKEAILSADAATDARFELSESVIDFHIRSMMCAPLVGGDGNSWGVLQIDTLDQRNRFSRDDLEVLASVACQAAAAVENATLHETAGRERAMEHELALAHRVQQGFLPSAAPQLDGYDFFEFYEPANKLGGDYFDYVELSSGRLGVVVADVAGKGIAAALLVARLSAETRYCLVSEASPAAAVGRLNRIFCDRSWEDRFVTFAVVVLDPRSHEMTVVNAGHMPPLLRCSDGTIQSIAEEVTKLPLGVSDDVQYEQCTLPIGAGDCLMLYTDGITDAMNDRGEFYGRPRLRAQMSPKTESVRAMGLRVLDDIKRFVGKRAQMDDMCMTCFGRVLKA